MQLFSPHRPPSRLHGALAVLTTLLVSPLAQAAPPPRAAYALEVPTEASLPVFHPRGKLEGMGASVAAALLPVLGEGGVVVRILDAAPRLMGVSAEEGEAVTAALTRRYDELADDPLWQDVETPLGQAFERRTPTMIVAPPRDPDVDPSTAPVVLFLHGYGGNGLLFAWLLSTAMPEAWVVAPSHSLTWRAPDLAYLDDALATFEAHRGLAPQRYHLIGLSDGAVGAFDVLAARPERFEDCVVIVGGPRERTIRRLPHDVPITWLAGRQDRFVPPEGVERRWRRVRKRVRAASLTFYDGGHYFLLNDDRAALDHIAAAVRDE